MGVRVSLVLYAPGQEVANRSAAAAYARIKALNAILSDYDAESELSRLSATAGTGQAVAVSTDLWHVLDTAHRVSEASAGAFDITVGPVVRLWRFSRHTRRLYPERIRRALARVDYRLVRLDPLKRTAELLKQGMHLDLGGIAKGYVVDEALAVLKKQGTPRALVDAGGDIALGDAPPGKPGWQVGTATRAKRAGSKEQHHSLFLSNVAIATSGDTVQFVVIEGTRYSHIVDPRTGLGLTDHSLVTVVAPDGKTADALASAVSVLGPKKGIALIENTPGAAGRIVRAPQGVPETHESKRWRKLRATATTKRKP